MSLVKKKNSNNKEIRTGGTESSRVDMSYIFIRLRGLSTPSSIQRGKAAIYRELRSILNLFEQDKEFMKLYGKDDK